MEVSKDKITYQDMGDRTSAVFGGQCIFPATKLLYGETADFFANEIKNRLADKDKTYILADFGSYRGELLANILNKLPDYRFETIAIDTNSEALSKNPIAQKTVITSAEKLPFADMSIDVSISRYLIQWNYESKQKEILKEISRVNRGFALVEHFGSDVIDTAGHRKKMDELFSGDKVQKMKREEYFLSSRGEIEKWMGEIGINFKRLKDLIVRDVSDSFIERYALSEEEGKTVKEILSDKDFICQTDWILFPKS